MNTGAKPDPRFEDDASRYAAYLDTPEGRLRIELPLENLRDLLPAAMGTGSLRALDLGGGTGAVAIRLARIGMHVTLLDSSAAMLALAEQAIHEAGVKEKIAIQKGDVTDLAGIFPARAFDIIISHNVLEFVDDPGAVVRALLPLLRNSSAMLSVLVRNRSGEVLKAALQSADLTAAEQNLTAEWGQESLYGGKVRLFAPDSLEAILQNAGLTIRARRGVRVIADYLPAAISRSADYERIFSLERKLGEKQEFFGIARYLHYLASRGSSGPEGDF